MQPQLKRIHSPDIDDLRNYQPENHDKFSLLIQAMIGPKEQEGAESFDIEICTPRWIEETHGSDDVIIGRHHFIVLEYNYERIINAINKYLELCSGDNWSEVARKVGRLGRWEFEDYDG